MGKGKKGKRQDDDWENDLEEISKETGIEMDQNGESIDDFVHGNKKEKKKKKGKGAVESPDGDDEPIQNSNQKSAFSALMMDDDNDNDDNDLDMNDNSPDEAEEVVQESKSKKKKGKKDKKKETAEDEDIAEILSALEVNDKKEPGGKKGKKKKKKDLDDDMYDIGDDAADATHENNDGVENDVNNDGVNNHKQDEADIVVSDENETNDIDISSKKSKKKKKKEVDDDLYGEEDFTVDGDKEMKNGIEENGDVEPTEGSTMKSAAQKKAEKKERDKKKKEAAKKKKSKKKNEDESVEDSEKTPEIDSENAPKVEAEAAVPEDTGEQEQVEKTDTTEKEADEGAGSNEEDEDGTSKDKKKKKKKKKKAEEEEKSKKTKKPGKSAILKMQEALEEVKREEARLIAEAEAKERALEEAENQRLEKLRLEQERKEKKKQKDKERKDRLKKEGKLLTPAQKEQKRKAEAMLEAMKQQGLIIPTRDVNEGDKPKKVMYGKKKKPNQKQQQQQQQEQQVQVQEEVVEESNDKEVVEEVKEQVKEEIKPSEDIADSWDAEEDIADSWDASDDDSKETKEVEVAKVVEAAPLVEIPKPAEPAILDKQKSVSTGDEDEEEEEEEDDEDDEESSDDDDESGSESESDSEEDSSSEEESSSDEEDKKLTPERIKERARERIEKRKVENEANRKTTDLRAPVICVLGHVDTGKTKILDKIRRTNVQDGEAGGITQQIGATNIPVEKIREQTKMVKEFQEFNLILPGLLVIDTPGHESFSNLRSRGSNLCDMAILVVDIMHGLEPQTIESINLLKKKQTPFIVALNKIDRIFEWKKSPHMQVEDTYGQQKKMTVQEFEQRVTMVIGQFAEQGLNAALHFRNPDAKTYISLVPTSAHSGDGMGDLMALICTLTQTRLAKKLAYSEELESTVMEVKALPGLGTTIDVILVNGKLKEGDTIVTGGIEGAIVSQIRSVLTPQPMRELRVKAQYIHHPILKAAQGAKLCGKDFEKVLAGSPVYIAHSQDEIEVLKEDVEEFVASSLKAIKVSERGVYVQASTLGSLEALLEFLKSSKIPYCGVNIGPVHKKDIMRCSVMLEHEPMYAVVLAFDVKIERDAQEYADKEGIKIFSAEIIYHLFDQFTAYCEDYKLKKREEFKHLAVYPCKMRILPQHIFNTRDPIVVGVNVEGGTARLGTPVVIPSQNDLHIGFITGLEANHKQIEKADTGIEVCVKIEPVPGEAPKLYGRHFTHEDILVSKINRESIDVMKNYFREDMTKSDWQLIIELKKLLDIV